jgi:uncharacterized membrane protein (UPF0182 family)
VSRRRLFAAVGALVGIVAVGWVLNVLVGLDTNLLWFRSIDHESAYTRRLWTQILLFATFGALTAAVVAHTLVVAVRQRPDFKPDSVRQRWRYGFGRIERRLRKPLFAVIVAALAIWVGAAAARGWQTWLLWRNGVPTGRTDPQFHRDISYFLFTYPQHRMVLSLLFRIVGVAIVVLLITAYGYGALRLRGKGPKLTRALQMHLSALLGAFLVLKAFGYWLDRLATATSNRGVVTGPGYTDIHAVLPGKLALLVIAAICAALMFLNVLAQSNKLMLWTLGAMAGSALVAGVLLPRVVQQFWEKPSASVVERQYIARNISATTQAFGLGNLTTPVAAGSPTVDGKALRRAAAQIAQIRLLDPNRVSPTFNVLQQHRSYYGFKSTLDIDHYPVDGREQDVALAVRELNLAGLPKSQQSWANRHLVYTHGYGVVAAPTDKVDDGQPDFIAGYVPQHGVPDVTDPDIFYGQHSPAYSIVNGNPANGGVPIGSAWHRLAYAWKLHSTSLLFTSQIRDDSRLLYNRDPRSRVAAVAPWLTLDGDTYPVVVDGHVEWVVDGYTTSNSYPYSQQINLQTATTTTYTTNGASVAQPNVSINYLRNSVKAVVDASSGAVTLYAWDQADHRDPVLATWEKAFPGLVKPEAEIPASLLPHLRYPTDLFNVQRSLLTRYHVTNPAAFYSGSDFWKVPSDPTQPGVKSTNALGQPVTGLPPAIPATYLTLTPTGEVSGSTAPAAFKPGTPFGRTYSLSSPLATLNRRNLAAFLSVQAQPGPGYGRLTLLEVPSTAIVDGPSQIQNDIESTPRIANRLSLERTGSSKVVLGNLLSIPLAGQFLYVEPIYTQSTGGNSFPILRHVAAVYADGPVGFASTLDGALKQALAGAASSSPGQTPH